MAKISYQFKFIIIGDSNVGKTTLLQNFVDRNNEKKDNHIQSTLGLDILYASINRGDKRVFLELVDTAGTEKYNSILQCNSIYKGAQGIIFVYDVTNKGSFLNVKNLWINRIKSVFDEIKNYNIIIVANKIDIDEKERQVTIEEGQSLTNEYGLPYIMMSALYKDTLELPFIHLINNIFENEKDIIDDKQKIVKEPVIKLDYDYTKYDNINKEKEECGKC